MALSAHFSTNHATAEREGERVRQDLAKEEKEEEKEKEEEEMRGSRTCILARCCWVSE